MYQQIKLKYNSKLDSKALCWIIYTIWQVQVCYSVVKSDYDSINWKSNIKILITKWRKTLIFKNNWWIFATNFILFCKIYQNEVFNFFSGFLTNLEKQEARWKKTESLDVLDQIWYFVDYL